MSYRNIYEFYEHMSFVKGYAQVLCGNKFYKQFIVESLRNNFVKYFIFR